MYAKNPLETPSTITKHFNWYNFYSSISLNKHELKVISELSRSNFTVIYTVGIILAVGEVCTIKVESF